MVADRFVVRTVASRTPEGQTGTHNAEVEGSGASLTTNKNEFKEKAVSSCIITMMR